MHEDATDCEGNERAREGASADGVRAEQADIVSDDGVGGSLVSTAASLNDLLARSSDIPTVACMPYGTSALGLAEQPP